MATCELCKHELMEGARFCSFCGANAIGPSRKDDFELGKLAAIGEVQNALVERLKTYAVYLGIPFVVLSGLGLDAWLQNKAEQLVNVELRTDLKTLSQKAEKAIGRLDLITTDLVAARIQYQFALSETFALLHESLITFDETLQRANDFVVRARREGPSGMVKDVGASKDGFDLDVRLAALDLVHAYGDFLLGLTTGEGSDSTKAFLASFTTHLNNLNRAKGKVWGTAQLTESLSALRDQKAAVSVIEPAGKVVALVLKVLEADTESANQAYAALANRTVLILVHDVRSTAEALITHVSRYDAPNESYSKSAKSLENQLNKLIAGIVIATPAPMSFRYSMGGPTFSPTQGAPEVHLYLKLIESDVAAYRAFANSVDRYQMTVEAYKISTQALAGTYQNLAQLASRDSGKNPDMPVEREERLPSPVTQTKVLRELARELSTASFQLRRAQANYRIATQGLLSKR